MNSSNVVKVIVAVIFILIIGIFVTGKIQIGQSDRKVSQQTQSQAVLSVGNTFPDFNLTEVDGKTITNDSLRGKPAIVWFTTSWCVPCQIGGLKVSKLDDELGGKALNVLVVFVDPKETGQDLRLWRKRFAREDWMVAFDNELTKLAARVNLKFLDSKFILDKSGVIKNIDFKQADENYINTIKQVVSEN